MANSDIFLDAFAAIETYLRRRCGINRRATFYQLVDDAARSLPNVRRYRDDLKEYADLRNAIVHERTDKHVIAEPNDKAVKDILRVKSLILKPPTVIPLFQSRVAIIQVSDTIGSAAKLMFEHSFSQMPVSTAGKIVGLLTANTISRWLGAIAAEGTFNLNAATISDVLRYTEDAENHVFVGRNTTLFDVLEQFQKFESRGKKLDAVLVTETGKSAENLVGILTVADLPKILSLLQ